MDLNETAVFVKEPSEASPQTDEAWGGLRWGGPG